MFKCLKVVYLWQAVDRQNIQNIFIIEVSCRLGIQGRSLELNYNYILYRYKLQNKCVHFIFFAADTLKKLLLFSFGTKNVNQTCDLFP